mgnify:CR=1 FL=1
MLSLQVPQHLTHLLISIILKTISSAVNYIVDMFVSEIHALGIHCSDTEDLQYLQQYIAGLYKSIN